MKTKSIITKLLTVLATTALLLLSSCCASTMSQQEVPVGTIIAFGGELPKMPANWTLCDGREFDTTGEFKTLFDVIRYSWGGSKNKFNVPDLRGRFLRGLDDIAGNDPDKESRIAIKTGGNTGNKVGSLQLDEFKKHTHTTNARAVAPPLNGVQMGNGIGQIPIAQIDSTGGYETRPKNVYVNYLIKCR